MKNTGIIIKKELYRVFGDRKLCFSLFILPAIMVIGIYWFMGMIIGNMVSDVSEHIGEVVIVDATEDLKSIVDSCGFLGSSEVEYITYDEYKNSKSEYEESILNGMMDMVVVVDSKFEEKVASYKTAGDAIPSIVCYYNNTEQYSSETYGRFSYVLEAYRSSIIESRLGNVEILNVFEEQDELIFKEEKANTEFLSMMLPYFITLLLFSGAMSLCVDAIAGEKERGTLASMLISPAKRSEIVVGKLVSLSILSGLSSLVYSASMLVAMPLMNSSMGDASESGFGSITFNGMQIVQLFVTMLVMVYFYVALISFLSIIAKDVKTASTYISPVYIVVLAAGMLTMFQTGKAIPTIRYCIPVYGNALVISDLCAYKLQMGNFLASLGGTILVAALFTFGITKAINSEKVMFNA